MNLINKDLPPCGTSAELLKDRQNYSLNGKIHLTNQRIKEWYEHWNGEVYVAFSGGKDSTVLLHLVRKLYPEVPAVFADTGLEYPEIRKFIRTIDNVTWAKPAMNFRQVLTKYGYPVISKLNSRFISDMQNATKRNVSTRNLRLTGYNKLGKYCPSMKLPEKWKYLIDAPFKISDKCCDIMKKAPMKKYVKFSNKKAIIGTMVVESNYRRKQHLMYGCNAFDLKFPISQPMAFWKTEDVWEYIKNFNIPYSKIYDMGELRTGCVFCMFGCHLEKTPNRFQRMQKSHPKLWKYCMNSLGLRDILKYMKIPYGNLPREGGLGDFW